MKFKQFVVNEYVSFRNMQSVRRKFKKNKYRFDKIVQAALNPDHINDSLAAIREVNAAIASKILQIFIKL